MWQSVLPRNNLKIGNFQLKTAKFHNRLSGTVDISQSPKCYKNYILVPSCPIYFQTTRKEYIFRDGDSDCEGRLNSIFPKDQKGQTETETRRSLGTCKENYKQFKNFFASLIAPLEALGYLQNPNNVR